MATKTVRLDEPTEQMLEAIRERTGLSTSTVLKRGVQAVYDQLVEPPSFWEVYEKLDLGPGGDTSAPATDVKRVVKEAIRMKLRR